MKFILDTSVGSAWGNDVFAGPTFGIVVTGAVVVSTVRGVSEGVVSTGRGGVGITVVFVVGTGVVRGEAGAGASGIDRLVHPAVKMIAMMRKATSIPE